jgi:hypothetical protein
MEVSSVRQQAWIIASCLALGISGPALAAPAGITGAEWAKVDKGEVVIHIGAKQGSYRLYQAVGQVNGKPEQIYRMLTDFEKHTTTFSKVKTSTVQKRLSPTTILLRKDLDLPWPMTGKWNLSEATVKPAQFGYSWKSVDGNVGKQYGSYETITRGGKSVVVYQIWYDMSTSGMPQMIFDQAQRVALPDIIKDLRKAVSRY